MPRYAITERAGPFVAGTVAGAGDTIRSFGARLKLADQYSGATLWKNGTNELVLLGDVTAI
jgi:hypothetical protein